MVTEGPVSGNAVAMLGDADLVANVSSESGAPGSVKPARRSSRWL